MPWPCVRLFAYNKSVVLSKRLNGSGRFWHRRCRRFILYTFSEENRLSPKLRVLPSGTLSKNTQIIDFENFARTSTSIVASVVTFIVRPSQCDKLHRRPSVRRWVSIFVCNTMGVTTRCAGQSCGSCVSLSLLLLHCWALADPNIW